MGKATRLTMLVVMVGLIAFSGCASRKTGKKVDTMQAQVNAMTDELVRLDQSLQDTRASIQAQENAGGGGLPLRCLPLVRALQSAGRIARLPVLRSLP